MADLAQAEGRSQSQVVERLILAAPQKCSVADPVGDAFIVKPGQMRAPGVTDAMRGVAPAFPPVDAMREVAPGQRDEHGREVNKAVRKAPAEFVPHDPQKEFTKPRALRREVPKPGWKG